MKQKEILEKAGKLYKDGKWIEAINLIDEEFDWNTASFKEKAEAKRVYG